MSIRILIVDDDELLRNGLRLLLEVEPDFAIIGEAGNGEEAIAITQALLPDVVLMDIRLPQLDGLAATRRIVEIGDSRVLLLTNFIDERSSMQARSAGASGFLPKRTAAERLIREIRILARQGKK